MVHLLMRSEEERRKAEGLIDETDLEATAIAPIVTSILELTRQGIKVEASAVCARLSEEDGQRLTRILFRDEPQEGSTLEDCLHTFQRDRITREGRQVARGLEQVSLGEDSSDNEELDRRLMQLQQLARQRDALL